MIELTHASFQYENSDRGVRDISLSVKGGECVVLTGLSGCGKTTVTRLVNGLAPSYYPGAFSGSVRIDGKDISRLSTWEIGRLVGSVFQDPKSQFFSSELAGEVAFPCENYGLSALEIREKTDAAIEALKLSRLKDRAVDILSSGEKQRAAIASVYAMKPKVFVCDEPTANLDAAGTRQLAQTLRQLKEQGFTLLIAEHRIDWLMGIADRFLYLRDGRIAAEYTPEDLLLLPEADILGMGLRSPRKEMSLPAPSVSDESPAVLKTAGLLKRIRKEVIFEDISLSVREGSVTAITGQNGAGKTTLAQILCGLAKQTRGHILIDGKKARAAVRRREIYYCGNDTSTQFFTASVAEELLLNTRLTEENKDRARNLLKEFGLYEYRDAHPSALSGGQKQRLSHSPPGAGLSVLPPAGGVHHGGNGAGTGRWRRMRKASAPRKLSPDVSRRLSDSRRQSAALTLREIHCPFCSFLVEKVFSDAAGHKMVYCRKCKSEYPINLGCFRRMKAKQAVCRLFSGKPRQKR